MLWCRLGGRCVGGLGEMRLGLVASLVMGEVLHDFEVTSWAMEAFKCVVGNERAWGMELKMEFRVYLIR